MDIAARLEFPPGMKRGHDDFQCRLLKLGVFFYGNTSSIIRNANTISSLFRLHHDRRGMPINHFIDRIVENFPD